MEFFRNLFFKRRTIENGEREKLCDDTMIKDNNSIADDIGEYEIKGQKLF